MIYYNILWSCNDLCDRPYAVVLIAKSQNQTNETDIRENQTVSGRISGFGGDINFGPRVVDDPAMANSS